MAAFAEGMRAGLSAVGSGVSTVMQAKRMKRDEEEFERELALRERGQDLSERELALRERRQEQDELSDEVDRRHKAELATSLFVENQMKKDELARYSEAEEAWQKFDMEVKSLDWSRPEAGEEYQRIRRAYLPTILKHQATTRKYEALNDVLMKSENFITAEELKTDLAMARREIARNAPWLLLTMKKKEDGTPDYADLVERYREHLQAINAQRIAEREASRSPGRAARRTLGPGDKATLAELQMELREINRQLAKVNMMAQPNLQLKDRLTQEKQRLYKAIRKYNELEEEEPDTELPRLPQSGGASRYTIIEEGE